MGKSCMIVMFSCGEVLLEIAVCCLRFLWLFDVRQFRSKYFLQTAKIYATNVTDFQPFEICALKYRQSKGIIRKGWR